MDPELSTPLSTNHKERQFPCSARERWAIDRTHLLKNMQEAQGWLQVDKGSQTSFSQDRLALSQAGLLQPPVSENAA